MLIRDPLARAAAAERKALMLLRFLREELWTDTRLAARVMGIRDRGAVWRALQKMEKSGLIVRDHLPTGTPLVGITPEGQAQAAAQLGLQLVERHFERRRLGLATAHHRLDVQALRLALEGAGWAGWSYPDRVSPQERAGGRRPHRPDAVATTPRGQRAAIEVERCLKTRKRYRAILGAHAEAVAAGHYDKVIYAVPDEKRAEALRRIWAGLGHVLALGRQVPAAEALRVIAVTTYETIMEVS